MTTTTMTIYYTITVAVISTFKAFTYEIENARKLIILYY